MTATTMPLRINRAQVRKLSRKPSVTEFIPKAVDSVNAIRSKNDRSRTGYLASSFSLPL